MQKILFGTACTLIGLTVLVASAQAKPPKACSLLTSQEISVWLGAGLTPTAKSAFRNIEKPNGEVVSQAPSGICEYMPKTSGNAKPERALKLEVVEYPSASVAIEQTRAGLENFKAFVSDAKITTLKSPGSHAVSMLFLDFTEPVMKSTVITFIKKNLTVHVTFVHHKQYLLEFAKQAASKVFARLP